MLDLNRSRTLLSSVSLTLILALPRVALADLQQAPPNDLPPVEPPSAPAPAAPAPPGGLKIEGNGATVKLGFLLQPAYEFASGSAASGQNTQSFFLRRARLMVGMTLGSQLELFFETDSPNLGKVAGVAPTVGANVQDAFATWKPRDEFKLDLGMMLIPLSHNSVQGATTLYGWDYFAYSFQQSGPLGNYVGRDTGLQARGLIARHLEYRLGLFTGRREALAPMATETASSRTALRFAGRLQYNVFDAETAYFYAGTYGGTKRILSFGAGIDHQDDYTAFAVDGFVDWPLGPDVFTAQAVVMRYDGGTWIPLPKQTAIMGEVGYRFGALRLSPIFRFENQSIDAVAPAPSVKTNRFGFGVAWWVIGHNANLKLFYTYIKPDNDMLRSWSQLNLQMQFYLF
jgi:hypothetical protein